MQKLLQWLQQWLSSVLTIAPVWHTGGCSLSQTKTKRCCIAVIKSGIISIKNIYSFTITGSVLFDQLDKQHESRITNSVIATCIIIAPPKKKKKKKALGVVSNGDTAFTIGQGVEW